METPTPPSLSLLNLTACRRHALRISNESRDGKFTRVSSEFLANVEAQLQSKINQLRALAPSRNGKPIVPLEGEVFMSARARKQITEAVNVWIAEEIHRLTKSVQVGKTF